MRTHNAITAKLISYCLVVTFAFFSAFSAGSLFAERGPQTAGDLLEVSSPAGNNLNEESRQRITMDLKGVDILDVLKILSKQTGLNIVAGRDVQGSVTLFLQNIDAWNALRKILETANLAFVKEEGIIRVVTEKEYEQLFGKPFYDYRRAQTFTLKFAKATDVAELLGEIKTSLGRIIVDDRTNTIVVYDIPQTLEEVSKIVSDMDVATQRKVFSLRYASAEDLESKLKDMVNPATGTLEVDKRSNRVYMSDIPERVRQVEALVQEFDMQPAQVLIEAKVVEVVLNDQTRFGIDWNLMFKGIHGRQFKINSNNNTPTNPTQGPLANATLTEFIKGTNTGISGDNFNFIIQALEGIGKANVLSSPRLTVLNNQEAKLAVATKEPFISQTVVQGNTTATTADNVQFVDVGVTLTVKPTITEDNHVVIKIKPAVSSSGTPLELQGVSSGSNTAFVRTRVPVVTTQEVETTVIVKSGTTIVMGGLIQDRLEKTAKKIPVIADIPFFGYPFRSKGEDFKKTELVVFLTPFIIKPNQNTEETRRFLAPDGSLLDFDKTANVDYVESYRKSDHPLKRRGRPYWYKEPKDLPKPNDDVAETSVEPIVVSDTPAVSQSLKIGAATEASSANRDSSPDDSLKQFENKKVMVVDSRNDPSAAMDFPAIIGKPVGTPRFRKMTPEETSAQRAAKSSGEESIAERAGKENGSFSSAQTAADAQKSSLIPENQSVSISQEIKPAVVTPAPAKSMTWPQYYQALKTEVAETLKQHPTVSQLRGEIRVEFTITGSGKMRDLKVLDSRDIRGAGQKSLIQEALSKRASYSPIPPELGDSKKVQLTLQL